jgi:formylglycine-generating enzyme required for sulfatase activity/tRNA A-37 threonylcarbamoyl transferase component Bud32
MNADASVGGKITREVRPEGASPGGYTLGAGEVLGQYRIVRPLGRGGMGEVYEAENVVNRKRVALKVLPRAATGGTFVDRFRIESRVMMDLEHPGIVRVHHAGEEQGVYYLTMDLVTGPDGSPHSLEDLLAAQRRGQGAGERPFAEHEVRRMALEVCEALAYAHGKGVVHRDLKPANLLVGPDGSLRVTDFGLAKVVGSDYLQTVIERSISLSLAGEADRSLGDQATQGPGARRPSSSARALLGTYDYMAPEQKSGGEITPRADIYAFGVLLYRLLTGEKPEGAYKAPSRLGRSRRWDVIVERCLQRNPADRYASAAELRQALAGAARRPRVWKAAAFAAAGLAAAAAAVAMLTVDGLQPGTQARRSVALEEQEEPNPGEEMTVDLGGGVKLTLCWCPAGNFLMGSPSDEESRDSDEAQHRVTLTKGFWMGKYEVTQGQWERVMGSNPSGFTSAGASAPVEQVSWDDCQEFIRKVNALVSGGGFRLPTEAEWEYACRAGTTGPYAGNLDDLGWYGGNSDNTTHAVGRKKANAWNLYDMHGNVWEWCSDWHGEYPSGGVSDPTGPGSGSFRVIRGGSWDDGARICRSAIRFRYVSGSRGSLLGLRLARNPQSP